jgi:hypothetical protein
MDINITGTIAENLVENLEPQFWNSALIFGVITAIITSIITFGTVKITIRSTEAREERNRYEDRQKILWDQRRQAYIQFICYMTMTDAIVGSKHNAPSIDNEKYLADFVNCSSGIMLLSPNIGKCILDIFNKMVDNMANFEEKWKITSKEIKVKVVPLMQAELGIEEH